MVDGTRHDGTPEDDPVEEPSPAEAVEKLLTQLEAEGVEIISRAPIAAVVVGRVIGAVSVKRLVVICSDGSCFRLTDPEWTELEPVPGTERALQLAVTPRNLCGLARPDSDPPKHCVNEFDHEPPHIDETGHRWE